MPTLPAAASSAPVARVSFVESRFTSRADYAAWCAEEREAAPSNVHPASHVHPDARAQTTAAQPGVDRDTATATCTAAISVGAGVREIHAAAHRGRAGATVLNLPAGLRSIGDVAFAGCAGLVRVELPDSLQTLGVGSFQGCTGLAELRLPAALAFVPASAFKAVENRCTQTRVGTHFLDSVGLATRTANAPSRGGKGLCGEANGICIIATTHTSVERWPWHCL